MKLKERIFRKCATPLLFLIENEGSKNSMNQVARKLNHNISYTARLVKLFLEKKLVTKKKFNEKEYHLYLTEKGKKIVNELRKIIELIE